MSDSGDTDPTLHLAEELGEVARVGGKPWILANLSLPALLSLGSVMDSREGKSIHGRATAFLARLELAIDGLGPGSRMSEAARVLFGLDPDARDLTFQDRRDRAAQIMEIRGGWDSFRKGPEKRILREVAEQLYRLDSSRTEEPERATRTPEPPLPAFYQLPADAAHFTGREAELDHLRGLLVGGEAQTVVISAIAGIAGVGKTTLALHLAHELAPRFPDAQLYVNLHGYDARQRLTPAQVLDRFLRALGVAKEALPTDVEEQAALYRGLLRQKRALVVLDNAFSAEQVRLLLPGSSTCLALITSRDRLAGLVASEGAHLLMLDVLAPEEALQLLGRIIGQERLDVESEAAAELTRLCGYLPLAVRIAAAKLASRPGLSITALVERLADEARCLGELSAGDVGVRASFSLSYQALDPDAARLFRRLGLIAGPDFGPGVAAALIDATPETAKGLLEVLVDANLLEAALVPERYRFHDLMRLYARECLQIEETERGREDALRRILDWYLRAADATTRSVAHGFPRPLFEPSRGRPEFVFATPAQGLDWLEVERPSLVAAIHQAADCGLQEIAWQLADVLWVFFMLRKHWADLEDTYRIGLVAARKAGNRGAEAWMLSCLGEIHVRLRRYDEAMDFCLEALSICREIDDRLGEARTLYRLGGVYIGLRRYDEARDFCLEALSICREVGGSWDQGWILDRLAEIYTDLRRYDEALEFCLQGLAIARMDQLLWAEAWSVYRLGGIYAGLGRHEEALDSYQEALVLLRGLGDRLGEGWTLYRLGGVYADLHRHEEAIDFYQQGLETFREAADRLGEGCVLRRLGEALQRVHGIEAAQACWREALIIFTELGAPQADDVRVLLGDGVRR
jgi:tetratricopeptide (TPR) repeat protein